MLKREAFHVGIVNLLQLQVKLERPPKRKYIKDYVHTLVKEASLREDPRRHYFELLATCALMGVESMYNAYHPRRKHGSKKENRS
jgi:hypothetical protein